MFSMFTGNTKQLPDYANNVKNHALNTEQSLTFSIRNNFISVSKNHNILVMNVFYYYVIIFLMCVVPYS